MSAFRIFGIVLALVGVVAAIFPSYFGALTGGPLPPADVFAAVERRIRGGMLLGVGLAFLAVTDLRPWSTSIPVALVCFLTGALAARILGLFVDGTDPKQWLWVAVEALLMAAAAAWLWRYGATA
ncbi:MAG: DUF4345 family protein [Sandaracinus sp.]|nr:DUF4345 family protein [Myxococcales bacterium]MCB9600721.1 DUF4345 family protein [Sandaracinus sp.]MCB9631298.1 DUF4345 family protein [Sandaracinus sp.]